MRLKEKQKYRDTKGYWWYVETRSFNNYINKEYPYLASMVEGPRNFYDPLGSKPTGPVFKWFSSAGVSIDGTVQLEPAIVDKTAWAVVENHKIGPDLFPTELEAKIHNLPTPTTTYNTVAKVTWQEEECAD